MSEEQDPFKAKNIFETTIEDFSPNEEQLEVYETALEELAEILLSLTYKEMMAFAADIADYHFGNGGELADGLVDWASAMVAEENPLDPDIEFIPEKSFH